MARSKSSGYWLREHFDDEYVKRSQQQGYRSRAVYKLLELQEKDRLFKPGMLVVDLGAAPGGWSQLVAEILAGEGRIVASDILPLDPLPFVEFVQGDFTEQAVLDEVLTILGQGQAKVAADVVISDMAPNMTGVDAIDQPQSIYLCELSLDLARQILKPGGSFVVKLFQGAGSDEFIRDVKSSFSQVRTRKPKASRARSREVYIVAKGYHD